MIECPFLRAANAVNAPQVALEKFLHYFIGQRREALFTRCHIRIDAQRSQRTIWQLLGVRWTPFNKDFHELSGSERSH